jgi:demethylspheroidene O-methyltransferase
MADTLKARWIAWRNARIMDPAFQRLAWRVPGLRWIARRRAAALFDLVAGFTYSQWLAAAVRLGVFPVLAERPLDPAGLAEALGEPEEAMRLLLRAMAVLDLAEPLGDGRYALGQVGASIVRNAGVQAMVCHHADLWPDLADPVALLRQGGGGRLSGFWPYAEGRGGDSAPYSALMAVSQPMVAETVLDALDLSGQRVLLDIGGGSGAFLAAAIARWPHFQAWLFDLPDVVPLAAERLGDSARLFPGRFPHDALPTGADTVTLIRILHDHPDSTVAALLTGIRRAMAPGGLLIVAEPMAGARHAPRVGDAYFGLYLRAMGSGRARTAAEISAMLEAAGFGQVRQLPTANPFAAQMVTARVLEEGRLSGPPVNQD